MSPLITQKFPQQTPIFLSIITVWIFFVYSISNFIPCSSAQNVPPGQDISAQSKRVLEASHDVQKAFEAPKKHHKSVEAPAKEKKATAPKKASFILKTIDVQGETIFSPKDITAVYARYINQKVTMTDINQILGLIESKYQQKGYFTATAYLPAQKIKDGRLKISIIEGKMGNLHIEGNKYFSSSLMAQYIHETKDHILNMYDLSKDVLRLNQNNDLQAQAVISRGEKPQTVDVTLKVQDQLPWHSGVSVDNRGSRLLGYLRGTSYIRSNNATGRGDAFYVSTVANSRMLGEIVSYKRPIDTKGTQIGLNFSHFDFKVGKEFKSYNISGTSDQGSLELSKELYLSENFQNTVSAGMDIKSIQRYALGQRTADDQLRIPYLGLNFLENDTYGTTVFAPRIDFGTSHFLGASSLNHPSAGRTGTGGFYFRYSQSVDRTERMPWQSYLHLRASLQTASHTLPASEELQLGGEDSIRGYPEGDYLADLGGDASVEWNFPMYLIPKDWKLPKQKTPLRYQIYPYVFADMGGGMLKKVLPGEKARATLWSIGGGIKIRLYNRVYINLDWAKALGDRPTAGSGPSTFHFSFQFEV